MKKLRIAFLILFILPAYNPPSPESHFIPQDRQILSSLPDNANVTIIVLGNIDSPYAIKHFSYLGYTVLRGPKIALLTEIARTPYFASLNHNYTLQSLAANIGEGIPIENAAYGRTEKVNGSGITVAVIDTGIDDSHPSLAGKIVGRYDARGENDTPVDTVGHGTLVAATVAGRPLSGNVHFTSTGIAPEPGYGFPFAVYIPETTDVTIRLSRDNSTPGYDMLLVIYFPNGNHIVVDSSTEDNHVELRSGSVSNGTLRIIVGTSQQSTGYNFTRYLGVSFYTDVPVGGGIAQGANIYAIKVFENYQATTDTEHILDGINHAIEVAPMYNIRVANLSLGSTQQDPALDDAMRILIDQYHILPVVAAGNSGPNFGTIGSPAESPYCLAVGAATMYGTVTYYSSRGNLSNTIIYTIKPDVLAVGGGLYVGLRIDGADTNDADDGFPQDLYPNDLTAEIGTSFASPVVAGIAALLFSAGIDDPYLVKYYILSGTYETVNIPYKDAPPGEEAPNQPRLDRIGKDPVEGRGMTYLPAIMNMALRNYTYGSMPNMTLVFGPGIGEPKVYAFVVNTVPGENVTFTLLGSATLDVDLLVYSLDSNEIKANLGNPVPIAVSTSTSSRESVSFIANSTKYLLVIRRVSGEGNVTLIYKKISDTQPPKIEKVRAFMIYKYLTLSVLVTDNFGVTSVVLKDQTGKTYYLKPSSDTQRTYNGLIDVSKLDGIVIARDIGGNTDTARVSANGMIGIVLVLLVAVAMLALAIRIITKAGE